MTPRLLPCGDGAISVEFGETVDPASSARVLALDAALSAAPFPGVIETVPTYRSLHVQFDPATTDVEALEARLLALAGQPSADARPPRRWHVPVVYGGEFGIDLEALAERHGLSTAEVVRLHAKAVYRVYMIGFLPGFAYLGGLDARLHTPRRHEPRMVIPAQSIAIGGAQAAIGSVEGPSGWHLMGRTPARPFMRGRDPVFLFGAGDEVVFEPIPERSWESLDRAAAAGEPVATLEPRA